MSDRDRLAAFEAGFHRAMHVIAALLFAVLITQVDLHSRDVIADSAQSTLDYVTDLSGQRLMTFDVTIGVDLDLHGVLFISVVDSILPIPHSLLLGYPLQGSVWKTVVSHQNACPFDTPQQAAGRLHYR